MNTFLRKYSTYVSILLIPVLLISVWLFPSVGIILASTFLLFSLVIMTYSITEKHRKAYLEGQITKIIFLRNTFLEVTIILFTMLLAALMGNYIAKFITGKVTNELTKFIIGIIIGLLVGIGVGLIIKRMWEKIQQIFIKLHHNKTII